MRNIIIVEAVSTGYNYVEDVIQRGFRPVLMECKEEDSPEVEVMRKGSYALFRHMPEIIKEKDNYEETLAMVRELDPVLIIPGSETGVNLATMLSDDLGLPGNSKENLGVMTRKDEMHLALKNAGIRYIRGERVHTPEEALQFCRDNGLTMAVVKPLRSAGSMGLFLCDNLEDVEEAARKILTMNDFMGKPITEMLVQERIVGPEYIVNTVSCEGTHRLNSILRYKKEKTEEGGYIYDYVEFVTKLEADHGLLVEYALQVAEAIHFNSGIIHGEYMIDEKGPVLIEVNCRPMGCTMPAEYLDLIFGQHESDAALNSLLDRERFLKDMAKPYHPLRKGYLKLIMIPEEMEAEDHPIWEVAKQLRSTYKIVANSPGVIVHYYKTRDLETNGGVIYMVHDDESVVEADLHLLRSIEQKYFKFLINDGMSRKWFEDKKADTPDFRKIIEEQGCSGGILVVADEPMEIPGAQCVTPDTLNDANKGFDYVIIGYQKALIESSESELLRLLFDTMGLARIGGKVIIPEPSYQYLSYEREGAEVLMAVKGLTLDAYVPGTIRTVVGTNERG